MQQTPFRASMATNASGQIQLDILDTANSTADHSLHNGTQENNQQPPKHLPRFISSPLPSIHLDGYVNSRVNALPLPPSRKGIFKPMQRSRNNINGDEFHDPSSNRQTSPGSAAQNADFCFLPSRIWHGTISKEHIKENDGVYTSFPIPETTLYSNIVESSIVNLPKTADLAQASKEIVTTPYTCAQCASRFASREERRLHIQTVHAKLYQCDMCKYNFTRKFDLEKHIRNIHEKMRPYSCDQCHNAFGQKHHLVRHKKAIHMKSRDFICEICHSKFARKEHLANHKRSVHEHLKSFFCSLCDVRYCEKRALRRHLENVHSVKNSRSTTLAGWQPSSRRPPPSIHEILQL